MPTKQNDPVNHPSHYTDGFDHEVIELTRRLDFDMGNAVKYLLRAGKKGDFCEDYRKAAWYLDDFAANAQWRGITHDDVELAKTYNNAFVERIALALFDPAPNNGKAAIKKLADEIRGMAGIIEKEREKRRNLDDIFEALTGRKAWPNIPACRREQDSIWDIWSIRS